MEQDDAMAILIQWLRTPNHGNYTRYGYDVYLPSLLRQHLEHTEGLRHSDSERRIRELMPMFYAAGWELCRRGILRPGVREFMAQATDDGNAGNGYSITPFGRQWIAEADQDSFVPTEPGRFSQMLAQYRSRFGDGYYDRAQEAVRCYGAHAYLACCAMSGAAAESILLATAIAKTTEEQVLSKYRAARGRQNIENIVLGQARQPLKNEYNGYVSLLKYWRDSASHGHALGINDNEAYTSIALLLRFAMFTDENWDELVGL